MTENWPLILKCLFRRYRDMTKNKELENFCTLSAHSISKFPLSKINRWLGYVQGRVIAEGCTTVKKERDFTRPLFRVLEEKIKGPSIKDLLFYIEKTHSSGQDLVAEIGEEFNIRLKRRATFGVSKKIFRPKILVSRDSPDGLLITLDGKEWRGACKEWHNALTEAKASGLLKDKLSDIWMEFIWWECEGSHLYNAPYPTHGYTYVTPEQMVEDLTKAGYKAHQKGRTVWIEEFSTAEKEDDKTNPVRGTGE